MTPKRKNNYLGVSRTSAKGISAHNKQKSDRTGTGKKRITSSPSVQKVKSTKVIKRLASPRGKSPRRKKISNSPRKSKSKLPVSFPESGEFGEIIFPFQEFVDVHYQITGKPLSTKDLEQLEDLKQTFEKWIAQYYRIRTSQGVETELLKAYYELAERISHLIRSMQRLCCTTLCVKPGMKYQNYFACSLSSEEEKIMESSVSQADSPTSWNKMKSIFSKKNQDPYDNCIQKIRSDEFLMNYFSFFFSIHAPWIQEIIQKSEEYSNRLDHLENPRSQQ